MGRAKEIVVKVIDSKLANDFVRLNHYSKKVVPNSTLHFGCFLDHRLHGVMSFGSPMIKEKALPLVDGTGWNEMLELNRMAFDNYLPKNSESRCISIAFRLIKKYAPQVKWVLSYSDGTPSGDGTIYRASGFFLTAIKQNKGIIMLPNGEIRAHMTFTKGKAILSNKGKASHPEGSKYLEGFQLRYIYLIDKSCKLTVPILSFDEIDKAGAGMLRGKRQTLESRKVKKNEQG